MMVIKLLPENIGLLDALHIAGKMEKLNLIDTQFDWKTGIISGRVS